MAEEMSVREAGRRGGTQTSKRHGVEHYQKIGKKGGSTTKKLVELGKMTLAEGQKRQGDA